MFLAIKDDCIGLVKNGNIVEAYDKSERVDDIVNGRADRIDKECIGERANAMNLYQITTRTDEYYLNHIGGMKSMRVSKDSTFDEVRTGAVGF